MRAFFFLALLTCSACGPTIGVDDIPFDGGSIDATIQPDDAPFPLEAQADVTKFNGGGDFLCSGCVCDGTLRYCSESSGPHAPILDASDDSDAGDAEAADADASACDLEAGHSSCTAIPLDCLPKPTCACLLTHVPPECTCAVDPSGSGLVVTCIFP